MAKRKPRPLRYYGGKQGYGLAEWINSHLPPPCKEQMYVEPFAGMAGVMMAREKAGTEILNDINVRVINWWLAVRDHHMEFRHLVHYTPHSERLYREAKTQMDDESLPLVRRALAFHIIVGQGIAQGDGGSGWAAHYNPSVGSVNSWRAERVDDLYERIRSVQIYERDAIELLSGIADMPYAVIYCDPPYQTANTSPYRYGDIDKDELTAALLAQKGFVAISGYGDEWEHLGWRCETKSALRRQINGRGERRIEKLWLNQDPPQRLF